LKIFFELILAGGFDPSDNTVFQTGFGVIFTVIIALEFKKSLWWWPSGATPLSSFARSS
jgi:hypothetical protein